MKYWQDQDGQEFRNSDVCWGRVYKPSSDAIDVAKISIRGNYPETGWAYNQESHEMAVVTRGEGWLETPEGRVDLKEGDVVHLDPEERFRWGGDLDLIIPCGPAFDPDKHHFGEEQDVRN